VREEFAVFFRSSFPPASPKITSLCFAAHHWKIERKYKPPKKLGKVRQQYLEFRHKFTGNVIFFQVGAFCEFYHAGDKSTADQLGLSTMGENRRGARYGFPMNKVKQSLHRLLKKRIPAMMVLEQDRYCKRIKERLPAFRFAPFERGEEEANESSPGALSHLL
jgi:hypothetical protein